MMKIWSWMRHILLSINIVKRRNGYFRKMSLNHLGFGGNFLTSNFLNMNQYGIPISRKNIAIKYPIHNNIITSII